MTTPLHAEKIVNAYKTQADVPLSEILNPPAAPVSRGAGMGVDPIQPQRYTAAVNSRIDQSGIDPILDPIHWDRVT